jgi:hypothetical protein
LAFAEIVAVLRRRPLNPPAAPNPAVAPRLHGEPHRLVVLLGCRGSTTPVITILTAAQIAEFTANAKIILPASAQPIGWHEERGMDAADTPVNAPIAPRRIPNSAGAIPTSIRPI